MDRDFKICIECIRAANRAGKETACNEIDPINEFYKTRSEDFLSGKQLPGCDKLLEHGVSVGCQKKD